LICYFKVSTLLQSFYQNGSVVKRFIYFLSFFLFLPSLCFGLIFRLPGSDSTVVGHTQIITVPYGFNITQLGQKYQVGYLEFYEANPGVELKDLQRGMQLVVPTEYVLPAAPHRGIVINLAELRLYYFLPHQSEVATYPVGVGRKREGSETPTIRSYIADKREHPVWRPTDATRLEALGMGVELPPEIEAGPENPLGDYAMRIGVTPYLIHGTNNPSGVGIRSSGGCLRMYPDDVADLFNLVHVGTPVTIVDQPVKVGWRHHKLYLEVHVPIDLKQARAQRVLREVTRLVMPEIKKYHAKVDWKKVLQVANQQQGIPTAIGYR
ncbi:MAG: L,D-transpeptidase family protein, partial [Gammaproteobacteria bacterium]|nr:L,D-transpeptidase family protein [Gammaproteobacteria bacterium]